MKDEIIAVVSEILSAESKLRELSVLREPLLEQLAEVNRLVAFQEEVKRNKEAALESLLSKTAPAGST
ncbi:hypothetical protein [Bordetella sp. 15P40C-2]|uniref:hypothetical protein n=1 Tax=Bordetella sp. 15P40C-2 TaxID=2572246 RepID=UPI00132219EB|nr:hypothetical protein [Bordetella sp. 15P40C-2]MVW72163.1 hypothetical protein [Bordetella sp. 15P40C-2]